MNKTPDKIATIKDKDEMGRERIYCPSTKRAVVIGLFGAGCYECVEEDGMVKGNHFGIAANDSDIYEWLAGGSPKLQRIYCEKNTP